MLNNTISFIHAADLHLDSPFQGLTYLPESLFEKVRQSTFHAFDHLIQTAINKKVDFILLVGDLFDNEKQSLKAQVHLRKAFQQLERHGISIYLSYGNHDFLNGNKHRISYPKNVHIFPNEKVTSFIYEKNGVKLASIYGFSYENQAVMENKVKLYQVEEKEIPFHVATLHGSVFGNKHHDPYAPFRLGELQEKPFDYWALGHIHKREVLSKNPPIVYPGNIQGRHRNEPGEKECYYVSMSKTNVEKQFIPLQSIRFETLRINISTFETIEEIRNDLIELLENRPLCPTLFYIIFSGNHHQYILHTDGILEELITVINEDFIDEVNWCYIYTYKFAYQQLPIDQQSDFFIGELEDTFNDLNVENALKDVYKHREMRRFLDTINGDELKETAKQLLFNELLESRNKR